MQKAPYGILGLVALCVILGTSCVAFRGISSATYAIRIEETSSVTEGILSISFFPHEPRKQKISLTCVLGDEEFSTTFTAEEDEWLSELLPILLTRPAFAAFLGPVMASQGAYALLFFVTQERPEKGLTWREKNEEGQETVISIPAEEVRFGREALWIHVKTDGRETLKTLVEKEHLIPFVVDILDPEENKRVYLEAKTITWEGTALNKFPRGNAT